MELIFVTGMSGAGKTTAIKMFEDGGFYCVDNLPVKLITKFVDIAAESKYDKIAIGIDIRSGEKLEALGSVLDELHATDYPYKILFLDADDDVLVKRYKETRRNHPLAGTGRIADGIAAERKAVDFLKNRADYIIDTTNLLTRQLRQELERIFSDKKSFNNMVVTVVSFGFKYGIPDDADLIFDVRFLPNPYYVEELKHLSGNDEPVHSYVMGFEQAGEFLAKLKDMVMFLLPNYVLEGKNRLVIGIGCTGGRHRSVTLADELYKILSDTDYSVTLYHRDVDLDPITKR